LRIRHRLNPTLRILKESIMNRKTILNFAIAGVLATSSAAFAARDPDVQNALKKAYPDAGTQITNVNKVNGVKVSEVKVTTKQGESTAEVTEYGDFLIYGVPHEYSTVQKSIQTATQGLFKTAPADVDMYRATNYIVDLRGPNNKTISLRYDAVGRLQDVRNTSEVTRANADKDFGGKASGDEAKKAEAVAKKEQPDLQVSGVFKTNEGDGFYYVQGKNGQVIVNPNGQVLSSTEDVAKGELPKPILDSISQLFGDEKITKASRVEDEYYQFNETSVTGEPLVVKMRPNGDILEVRNDAAKQAEQQLTQKNKAKSTGAAATPAASPSAPTPKKAKKS